MVDDEKSRVAAGLLAHGAHAARNQVATLRSVVLLIDDPDVAVELAAATNELQVLLERAITAARVELDEPATIVQLPVEELVRLAERRAVREGRPVDVQREASALSASSEVAIRVPGAWMERLLADLLHVAAPDVDALAVARIDGTVEFACTVDVERWHSIEQYARSLAAACGCRLESNDRRVTLFAPIA